MQLKIAQIIAEKYRKKISQYCKRVLIAGEIRCKQEKITRIDFVVIPDENFADMLRKYKYSYLWKNENFYRVSKVLPEGVFLRIHLADECNFGLISALYTGDKTPFRLREKLAKNGYTIRGNMITKKTLLFTAPTEKDVFKIAGIKYIEPENRQ